MRNGEEVEIFTGTRGHTGHTTPGDRTGAAKFGADRLAAGGAQQEDGVGLGIGMKFAGTGLITPHPGARRSPTVRKHFFCFRSFTADGIECFLFCSTTPVPRVSEILHQRKADIQSTMLRRQGNGPSGTMVAVAIIASRDSVGNFGTSKKES